MSKKRSKFNDIWCNQSELGKSFGLSGVGIGKKLKEVGLKGDDNKPTDKALVEEFAKSTPLSDGTPFFMWNRQNVMELLQVNGVEKLDPKEAKAQSLVKDWLKLKKHFEEAVSGFEEEMIYEEARDLQHQVRKQGLTTRVNEILRTKGYKGLLEE
jgi:hypothetical protein